MSTKNDYGIPEIQLKKQQEDAKVLFNQYKKVGEVMRESLYIENEMQKDTQDTILVAIGRLEGKVDGINQRLDTSNGRISKLEEAKDGIEKKLDIQDGVIKGVKSSFTFFNIIWGALIAFGGLVVAGVSFYSSVHK